MLVTARLYQQFQITNVESRNAPFVFYHSSRKWLDTVADPTSRARKMLLIHQAGSVKVGEIVR